MRYSGFALSIVLICNLLIFSCCGRQKKYVYSEGIIWNTTYHITYLGDKDFSDSIKLILAEVGHSLSVFDSTSLVSRINKNQTSATDGMFNKVYNTSRKIWEQSDGAFDPTLSPLITAWGFGIGHKKSSGFNVDSILEYVGLDKTELKGNNLIKQNPLTEFNFSAIAKGFGCDEVAEMFRRNGIEDYLIEIGGEIALGGKSPRGGDWTISIDKPTISNKAVVHNSELIIQATNVGIATSGNYRNYHVENNQSFGHTIDSKTGLPAKTDLLSATLICENAMEADAYATACMAMGSDGAKKMVERLDLAAFFILNDSTLYFSPSFKRFLPKKENKE